LPALAQVFDAPERGDHLLADLRAFTAAFDDLEIGATAGGLLAEVHGRLIPSQHMISAYATIIKRFATKRGTTLLRNPTSVSCNINDLQPTPTLQLLKISQNGTASDRVFITGAPFTLVPHLLVRGGDCAKYGNAADVKILYIGSSIEVVKWAAVAQFCWPTKFHLKSEYLNSNRQQQSYAA
jgi:hypothetical protein